MILDGHDSRQSCSIALASGCAFGSGELVGLQQTITCRPIFVAIGFISPSKA
jgi:hypothetical protein